jgi:mannose-1-phosphate guanylyltransferase
LLFPRSPPNQFGYGREPDTPVAPTPRFAVVMAGGAGTRFWPRSRVRSPKQLLSIVGGRSMLQETIARLAPLIARERILVVTSRPQARAVRAQLPGLRPRQVLVEPEGRNTAAAIALAALEVARRAPDASMTVLPADHAIGALARFRADLALGLETAERTGALVTFGIVPTHPETGYGYIRAGASLGPGDRVATVDAFVEKPPRERAEALIAGGNAFWNSGIFAWRVTDILRELRAHLPGLVERLERALGRRGGLARAYRGLASISIDHGVLERAAKVAVVRARFPWSDVGSWAAVEPLWRANGGANSVRGRALPVDSRGCVVDSPTRLVALLGVDDLVVVDTPDALLVCRKDRAQDVRLVVDELRRRGLERYL